MARKRHDFGAAVELQIKAMMVRGASPQTIAEALAAQGVQGASMRTIARRVNEMRPGVNAELARARSAKRAAAATHTSEVHDEPRQALPALAPVTPIADEPRSQALPAPDLVAPPTDLPPDDDEKPTTKDRQVDELMSRSLAWRRIQHAIASALASHPTAAAAVVRALRGVQL